MSDPTITSIAGLQLSNSTFSASPPGSLSKATNCVISQKGVIQPRNGQKRASTLPLAADLPFSLTEFQSHIIANYSTSKTSGYGLGYVSAGAITPYSGTFSPVGDDGMATDYARMKFTLASLFLHFCTALGPFTLESCTGAPRRSGLSRVPDFTAELEQPSSTPGANVIPYNSSVAFVVTHKRITSTGQVLTSPPSNRAVVSNRFIVAAGGLSLASFVVTATFGSVYKTINLPMKLAGTAFTLSPGETNFAAGSYATGPSAVANQAVWAGGAGTHVSTVAQELNIGPTYARLTIPLSADAVAGDIIQLYKSDATSNSSIEPLEDVYLCNEYKLQSGDISAGFVVINDYTPQSVCQVPLYTNPSDGDGSGSTGANFPPPMYRDAANWDSRTFYASTIGQEYLDMQMLGCGAPNGVQDGDTVTIFDGVATTKTYTFKNSPSGAGQVQLVTDGTPGYNIAWTSYFLVKAATPDFIAHGVGIFAGTSPNGFPGGIRLERTDYLQTAFQVKVSRAESWSPALIAATYTSSFASASPNGLAWGKAAQPEAVPVTNALAVGTTSYYTRRIFGLRNALIILKEGDGIWSLTGSAGNYNLLQISTANIIAPDCAAVFADCVWAYTDQGILRISDTGGVQVVSRQIETELNAQAAALPSETYAWSFAVPYETERRIMFFVPFEEATSELGGAPLMKAWVYSQATNAWTGPLIFGGNPTSGIVTTGHLLWVGLFDTVFAAGRITSERKTGTYLDIADASWSNTLTTTADPLVVQLATAGAIQEGAGIVQGQLRTKVAAVLGGGLYQVAETIPWANGACTVFDPYEIEVQFLPEGSPGSRKFLSRLFTLYRPESFANLFGVTTLFTDQIQAELEVDTPAPGYGSTPYGTGSYGNPSPMVVDTNPIKAQWANAGQFFPGFKLDEVWCQMKLQGLGMQVEGASGPVGRGV